MADYRCNARKKKCAKCGHRFSAAEYELLECPECGTGRLCQSRVTAPGKRCKMHGGMSLGGPASPRWKDGRYSRVLPSNLAERYEESRRDQELLALRDEIALLDSRLADLLGGLSSGGARKLWDSLQTAYDDLRNAMGRRDIDGAGVAIRELGIVIETGAKESDVWGEVYTVLEQRRRLTESEAKRLIQMQQVITTEQAMVMLARVQQAVIENVSDKSALAKIAFTLRELASLPAGE